MAVWLEALATFASALDRISHKALRWHDILLFCRDRNSSVPHMEPMPVETLAEARLYAGRLLEQHARPVAAHIFADNLRLDTVTPWLLRPAIDVARAKGDPDA